MRSRANILIYWLRSSITILVLLLLLFIAALTEKFSLKWDMTETQRNSLTERSTQIAQSLTDPVEVKVFFSQRAAEFEKDFKEVLSKYADANSAIEIEYIQSTLNPKTAKESEVKGDLEIHISYKTQQRVVTELSEEKLSNALLQLSLSEKRIVSFLTGHNELDINSQEVSGIKVWVNALRQEGIQVRTIDLLKQEEIDVNAINLLVIASPEKPFLEKEIKLIDNYILAGGNTLILTDPDYTNILAGLLKEYGVVFQEGIVADRLGKYFLGSPLFVMISQFIEHPTLDRLEQFLALGHVGSVDYSTLTDADGWKRKYLLHSSEETWLELSEQSVAYDPTDGDVIGKQPIALVMDRKLDSTAALQAFKNNVKLKRLPAPSIEENAESPNDKADDPLAVAEAGGTLDPPSSFDQKMIIIADSDFSHNQHIGRGANLDFAVDTVNWLSDNVDLLKISRKKPQDESLDMDEDQINLYGVFWGLVAPGLILILGFLLLSRRKRKHAQSQSQA